MGRTMAWCLIAVIVSLVLSAIAELAFGAPPVDTVERAAADPATAVQSCTCVEGPLALEIEKLRTQIRLLRAEAKVNRGIQCAVEKRKK